MEQKALKSKVHHANLVSERVSELKKKRRNVVYKKLSIICFSTAILLTGLVLLSRLDGMAITKITVEGNHVLETESLTRAIETELSGNYLFLFPKRNALLFPKSKIKKMLTNDFHRIETFSIERTGLNGIHLTLTERTPSYLWCGFVSPAGANEKQDPCYFVGEDGFIFDRAPYFSGSIYFKFYGTPLFESGMDPVSRSVASAQEFKNLIAMNKAIMALGLIPEAFAFAPEGRVGEAEFILARTGMPENRPKILFRLTDDLEKSVANLNAALSAEPLKTDIKAKYSSLQYLDLRFSDKVYFKFSQ